MFNPFEKPALFVIDGGKTYVEMAKLYEILEGKNAGELTALVTAKLASGWSLVGGPYTDGKKHFQAVQK